MADQPISGLTVYSTYHSDDEWEVLDVHDTTFASTGTNKRVTLSSLITLVGLFNASNLSSGTVPVARLPVMVASGGSHAAGVAPDPGSSAGTTRFLREDATYAVPPGGSATPGGSNTQLQYNNSGAFGGAADLTIGAGGEVVYGAIADPTLAAGASWQNSTLAVESGVSAGLAFRKGGTVWSGKNGTAVANTSSLTSIFTGATTIDGTLTIPANKAVVGKIFRLVLAGTVKATGTPTLTVQVLLGGVIVCQGTSSPTLPAGGPSLWTSTSSIFQVQAIGATGKIIGHMVLGLAGMATMNLGSSGLTAAPAQATVDFTAGALWDVKVQWSSGDVNNIFQLLYGYIEILD